MQWDRQGTQSGPGGGGWALLTGVSQRASESLCSGLEITDSIRLSHLTSPHLTSPSSVLLALTSHLSHSSFPVPKGINMTAPPNHPDPIYAGFSRPFERNPTTRVPSQHHRGGESGHRSRARQQYSHRYFTIYFINFAHLY